MAHHSEQLCKDDQMAHAQSTCDQTALQTGAAVATRKEQEVQGGRGSNDEHSKCNQTEVVAWEQSTLGEAAKPCWIHPFTWLISMPNIMWNINAK